MAAGRAHGENAEMNINPLRRKSRASSGTLQSLLSPITRPKEVNTPLIERLGGSKTRGLYQDQFLESLERIGISRTSPKFAPTMALLAELPDNLRTSDISNLKMHDIFLSRALDGELVIRDFPRFADILKECYTAVADRPDQGHVATYIPELALVDPDQFGASVCTIDGQQWKAGDSDVHFCIQSISKTITYLLALEEHGEQKVHSHVGREPSGVGFNERLLNRDNLPHNPFINSGAIMCASLVKPQEDLATRFDHVMNCWARLTGGRPTFANAIYLDERSTADRNYCLAYMMNEGKAFPPGTDLMVTLDFYFMLCSIEVTAEMLAVVAGTLASGGVCPITGDRVFRENHVRDCLSLMASCGLYDGSGEFFFDIGFPAKSGVAGGIMFAIPGILGVCTFAPRLEDHGNSYRGIVFCEELVQKLEYHQFSILDAHYGNATYEKILQNIGSELLCAVSRNDLHVVQAFVGAKPSSVHYSDYDRRTPLHIAASCGYLDIVKYLLAHGANVNYKDVLRNTPLDDAKHHGHQDIIDYLTAENTFIESYGTEQAQPGPAALFAGLDAGATGVVRKENYIQLLEKKGIVREATNWGGLYAMLDTMDDNMRLENFLKLSAQYPIAREVITSNLAVPDWEPYRESLRRIYQVVDSDDPPIRATNFSHMALDSHEESLWEASFCSTSGQVCRMSEQGHTPWRAMALSHIVNYLIAQELLGEEAVHAYVGKEPSGRNFNEFSLNSDGKPHNPVIVSGALAVISLIKPAESKEKRFKYILSQWRKLTLGGKVQFDEDTYQKEVSAVSRKWTLAYLLLESGAFPHTVMEEEHLQTTVELYFMTLSILVDTTMMSHFASVLANGGVDPFTQQRLFKKKVVRNVLSIMYACGMYDYSGEFTFRVGIPAQSSGGGGILGIVPELGGFCTFSPKLDQASNSVLGVRFCCTLTKEYSFHAYETLVRDKKDPSVFGGNWNDVRICNMFEAASKGDLVEVRKELDCLDINCIDYDRRTVLHVAASKNRKKVVYYLVENGADITLRDRWGHIPYECTRSKKLKELLRPPGMESDSEEATPVSSPTPTPPRGPEGEEPPNVAKSLLSKHMQPRARKGSLQTDLL